MKYLKKKSLGINEFMISGNSFFITFYTDITAKRKMLHQTKKLKNKFTLHTKIKKDLEEFP